MDYWQIFFITRVILNIYFLAIDGCQRPKMTVRWVVNLSPLINKNLRGGDNAHCNENSRWNAHRLSLVTMLISSKKVCSLLNNWMVSLFFTWFFLLIQIFAKFKIWFVGSYIHYQRKWCKHIRTFHNRETFFFFQPKKLRTMFTWKRVTSKARELTQMFILICSVKMEPRVGKSFF